MAKPKSPTRAEAIRQTLAHAEEPVSFDELLRSASAIFPMDAGQLTAALENLHYNDYVTRRLLQQTADGRFGWLPHLVRGARVRHTLTAGELKQQQLRFEPELCVALFPERVYHEEVDTSECVLPGGIRVGLQIEQVGQLGWLPAWGTRAEKAFWEWLKSQRAQSGDTIVFEIERGEASRCAVTFEPKRALDAERIRERSQLVAETILPFLKPKQNGMHSADIAARLLALGMYHDPLAPEALETILEHDPRFRSDRATWQVATRADRQYQALGLEERDILDIFESRRRPPRRKRPSKKELAQRVYCFLASFRHNKALWRRIEIGGEQELWEFDEMMRTAFGHDTSDHLSEFYLGTDIKARRRGLGAHNPFEGGDGDDWLIGELGLEVGDSLSYIYDFGDDIQHVLRLEAIGGRERGAKYPRVVEQNKPRHRYCIDCKAEGRKQVAVWICVDCSNERQENVLICDEHASSAHDTHFVDEWIY
jgi:hypothetical protein